MRQCSGRRDTGVITYLVNECAGVLQESLLVPVPIYGRDNDMGGDGGLGFGLYRWTTSEVRWVSGEWIKSRMHEKGSCLE